jgi:dynein heavy chain, axonemal
VRRSALILKLYTDDPKIEFQPTFSEIEQILMNCFSLIIESAESLARVEVELFPFPEYKNYVLKTIRPDEELVNNFIKRVHKVYELNNVGPQRYLDTYKKFNDFLTSKADQDVVVFLDYSENQLEDFMQQIDGYSKIVREITLMTYTIPLNLYSLECTGLHDNLRDRVNSLKDRVVQFCIDYNRETNRSLCKAYDEIADKVSKIPNTTAELVETMDFLNQSIETTVYKLEHKIGEAKKRLLFLMDYCLIPSEDIKLNSTVFFWPELVMQILEKNQVRLQALREKTEEKLRDRLIKFDEKLKDMHKRTEAFKSVGVCVEIQIQI